VSFLKEAEGADLMAEQQRHGRFYAQELMIDPDLNIREQIQDALDAGGERQEPAERRLWWSRMFR
jgi:hypothetical protein